MKTKLTVAEALQKVRAKESLQGYQVGFTDHKVEALEAMQLAKAGIDVPEESIYYDDEAIAEDEAFEGEWTPVDTDSLSEAEAEAALNVPPTAKPGS